MGVNNGYDIGVNGRDLILKTSGKIYVKVSDKFYELNFRNEDQNNKKTESSKSKDLTPDVVILDTLSNKNYPGDDKLVINNDELYVTKGGYYKKLNATAASNGTAVASQINDTKSLKNLFVPITDNVWGLGETVTMQDIEFIEEPTVKWDDYLFFKSVKKYFFDELSGNIDGSKIDDIFFNVAADNTNLRTAKSKSEIESTVLTGIYKNGTLVDISDFKSLYESFWYSEEQFNNGISEYNGLYATFAIENWTSALSPKAKIMLGEYSAIVTAVIEEMVIVKFKDADINPNLAKNVQKTAGSISIYKKEDVAFLDVLKSGLSIYNTSVQNEDDVHVRIGNLNTLTNHSGTGAFFNQNITVKNGPFVLNADGSGNIGDSLKWDSSGKLFGPFVDSVNTLITQYNELSDRVKNLEES